jgi:hypothetical protein
MNGRLHYSVDGTWFDYDTNQYEQMPACGYDFHGRKKLTEDWREVTCPECRECCGFTEAEQLTEVHSDPLLKVRKAA